MATLSTWKLSSGSTEADLEPVILPEEVQSMDEVSACLPGGAYTTLRTYYGNRALRFRDHVRRLEETSQLAGRSVKLDESSLRLALRRLLMNRPQGQDWRIRLTLDLEHALGDLYITLEPLAVPPPGAYQQGVRVITCDLQRQLPKAKLTRFIERAAPLRRSLPPNVNEAIMLDAHGRLLEGLSSNFFAVIDGVVWTADEGVLSGVTRGLVLDCARQIEQPVRLEPPYYADLPRFDEAFITSSSRGVLPVRQMDQAVIGTVCPGSVTRALMDAFSAAIENLAEPI